MATSGEILEALADYRERCNNNAKLRKMLRNWSRTCRFHATDTGDEFTVVIEKGEIVDVTAGAADVHDLSIGGTSEDLADMFWGDLNPAAKYLSGDIKVIGAAEDVLRVDAMAAVIWVDG